MHIPVLLEKVLEYLDPKPNQNFVDCTVGGGGHTRAILERTAPRGRVLAIDWDKDAIERLKIQIPKSKSQNRLLLRVGNFAEVKEIAEREKFKPVHGILFDLGFSSDHIEKSGKGFSFSRNEPLDMRYSEENPDTAEKILNWRSKGELESILKEYGEERYAKEIAEHIVETRKANPIATTKKLVEIVEAATPKAYLRKKIHPATRTFQALRIATNKELENLKEGLAQAAELVEQEGKIAVISFHSIEDRIVKDFFKQELLLHALAKKPLVPSLAEVKNNPRARSAKLRVAIRTS